MVGIELGSGDMVGCEVVGCGDAMSSATVVGVKEGLPASPSATAAPAA